MTDLTYLSGIDLCFSELEPLIEEWWRGHHPPGVPPHITLLAPWRSPVTEEDLAELQEVVEGRPPFEITFGSVEKFDVGFVYLKPEPNPHLEGLLRDLWAAFPDTPPYGGTIVDPAPHLTVMEALPGLELEVALTAVRSGIAEHLPVKVAVEQVTVLVSGENVWETWVTVPLEVRE